MAVGGAVVSFYVTYLAYRNVKSAVPLLRPGDLFDGQLTELERGLFGGNDPAALLHSLLGTSVSAEALALVYMAFFYFVMISLLFALVFSPLPKGGIFYVTALSINWALGAASYLLLPARGPIYATPSTFADLPATGVTHLQDVLLRQRTEFLREPMAADAHQGIAAFGSLHTSIVFTAAVAAHMLGLGRALRIGLWALFGLTTHRHRLLGLALRGRRSGRRRNRLGRARPRTRPDRLRAADRVAGDPVTARPQAAACRGSTRPPHPGRAPARGACRGDGERERRRMTRRAA